MTISPSGKFDERAASQSRSRSQYYNGFFARRAVAAFGTPRTNAMAL
jgi:hypothetical protein